MAILLRGHIAIITETKSTLHHDRVHLVIWRCRSCTRPSPGWKVTYAVKKWSGWRPGNEATDRPDMDTYHTSKWCFNIGRCQTTGRVSRGMEWLHTCRRTRRGAPQFLCIHREVVLNSRGGETEDLWGWKCVCPFSSANLKSASKQWHMRHHLQHVLPTRTQRSVTHTIHTETSWDSEPIITRVTIYTWQLHHNELHGFLEQVRKIVVYIYTYNARNN